MGLVLTCGCQFLNSWKKILGLPFFGAIKPAWTTLFYAALLLLFILFAGQCVVLKCAAKYILHVHIVV